MADLNTTPRSYDSVDLKAEGVTQENFGLILRNVKCPYSDCNYVGMWRLTPQNNGSGAALECYCHRTPPKWKTYYLPKVEKKKREAFDKTPREVWAENGDCCWFCQTRFDDLRIIGACYERQHAWGYSNSQNNGPIIPICSACHPHASALKAKHERIIAAWKARLNGDAA